MSIGLPDHAFLAQDSYNNRDKEAADHSTVSIGGAPYKILDTYSDPLTGYQGTAYQRLGADGAPTGDVVIAHRGTESILDGVVDAGMVLKGVSAQIPDAERFTARVLSTLKEQAEARHVPFDPSKVTVTGHSLGGTLAEYTAYKFHLHGETFNAYGAAGLLHGVPEGGTQVINYVRATDVVSAGSPHFGEERVLTTGPDVQRLHKAGYHDDGTSAPFSMLRAIDPKAHAIATFVPDAQGHSVLDSVNATNYTEHRALVDAYRSNVLHAREAISIKWEVEEKAADLAVATGKAVVDQAVTTSRTIADATVHGAHAAARTAEHVGQQVAHDAQRTAHAVGATYVATRDAAASVADKLEKQASDFATATGKAVVDSAVTTSRVVADVARQGAHAATRTAEHVGQHVADDAQRAAHVVGATYDATREAAVQAAKDVGHQAAHVARTASQQAQHAGESALRAATVAAPQAALTGTLLGDGASRIGQALSHAGQHNGSTSTAHESAAPLRLDNPSHPAHAMYRQNLEGIGQLNAQHGVAPSPRDEHIAGALTVQATAHGLKHVDQVLLNDDASRVFAVQGTSQRFDQKFASVDTVAAIHTSLEQSSAQWPQAAQQAQQTTQRQELQQAQSSHMTAQHSNGPSL